MKTLRAPIITLQCVRCPDVYIMVGNVPIMLAKPQAVTRKWGEPMYGVCPRHPRKGVAQDG